MDLSNRESAEHWYKQAKEVQDADLRKEAIKTYKKFRDMALREERVRLKRSKPGYGIRSMFLSIMLFSLCAAVAVLVLSWFFPIEKILIVLGVVAAISVVAWAIVLRVHGHVSEEGMLSMVESGLKSLASKWSIGKSEAKATLPPATSQEHLPKLPSGAPPVSFDIPEEK